MSGSNGVAIVGGCGHVGLPLGLAFADRGLDVVLYDVNERSVAAGQRGHHALRRARGARGAQRGDRLRPARASSDPGSSARSNTSSWSSAPRSTST